MIALTALLTNAKNLLVFGVILVVIACVGYVVYLRKDLQISQTKIVTLNDELKTAGTDITSLQKVINDQNAAIKQAADEATEKEQANAIIVAKAQKTADSYKAKAEQLLHEVANNPSTCISADDIINEQINSSN